MINSVVLVGRLTKDPELKKTNNGYSVCSFTLAVQRRVTSQNNQAQTADFINCVAWRQSAEYLTNYSKKGNLVSVEGRIQTRTYDNNQGVRQYVTEVLADSVNLLEKRQNNDGQNQYPSQSDNGNYNKNKNNYNNSFSNKSYEPPLKSESVQNDPFESSLAGSINDNDLPF